MLTGNTDMFKPNHHLMLREAGKALGGIYKIRIFWRQVRLTSNSAAMILHFALPQRMILGN